MTNSETYLAFLQELQCDVSFTKEEMANQLGVSVKSVERHLKTARENGYTFSEEPIPNHKGKKRFTPTQLPNEATLARFTDDEKEALAAALEAAQALLAHTHYEPHLKTVFDKLIQGGDLTWSETDARQNWYFEKTHATPPDQTVFKTIMQAIWASKTVKVDYESADRRRKETRHLVPYTLAFVEGDWTVFAYCPKHQEVRDFRIARISRATPLSKEIDPVHLRPAHFEPHEFYDDRTNGLASDLETPLHVRFRVRYPVAYWFKEKCWHSSQRNGKEDADGLWVEMRVGNKKGIINLLKRFGADIYVEHPPELQAALKVEAKSVARQYEPLP